MLYSTAGRQRVLLHNSTISSLSSSRHPLNHRLLHLHPHRLSHRKHRLTHPVALASIGTTDQSRTYVKASTLNFQRRKAAEEEEGNNARSPSRRQVKALSQRQGYGIRPQPPVLPESLPTQSSPSPITSRPSRPTEGGGTANGKGYGLKTAQLRTTNGDEQTRSRLSGGRNQPALGSENRGESTTESLQTRSGEAVTQLGASTPRPQSSPRRGFGLAKAPVSGHSSLPARPGRGLQAEGDLFLRPSKRAPSQSSTTHRSVDNDAPRIKSPPGLKGPVPPIRKNGESSSSSYRLAPRQTVVPDRNTNSPKPNPTLPNRDFAEEARNPTRRRAAETHRSPSTHAGDKVQNSPPERTPRARSPSGDGIPSLRDGGSDGIPKSSWGLKAQLPAVSTANTTATKAQNSPPPKPLTSPLSDGPKIGSKDATPTPPREYRFTPLVEPTATDRASAVDNAMWDLADVDQETLARQLKKEAGIMIVDDDTIIETNPKIRRTALWAERVWEKREKLRNEKRMARSRTNQNNGLAESDEGDQKGGFGGQEMEEESEYGGETFGSSAPQRISRDELMAQGMEGTALEPLKEVTRQKVDRGDAERRRHSNADGSEAQEQRKTPSPSYSGTTDGAASLPGSSRSAPMDDDAEGSAISSTLARTRQGPGPAVPTTSTDRDELAGAMFASDNSYEEGIEGESAGSQGDTPNTSGGITLRPYQHAAIQACVDAFDSGLSRIGVSSPTGSGKTTMFMKLIPKVVEKQLGDKVERKQTLIIVNSVELARQSKNAAERLLPEGWTVEVEQGSSIASGSADVTIATYQTLTRSDRVLKFDPERFGLVIVDEAHHAAARSYLQILHYFHEDTTLPSDVVPYGHGHSHNRRTPIVGFSATFTRPDQLALSAAFEKIVYHAEIATMLKAGWLAPAKWTTVKADLDLSTVEVSSTGDYSTSSLAAHLDTPLVNQLIVRTYLHLASERRSTLVFCVNLTHVDNLVSEFRQAGIDARSVSSTSKPKDRRETLEKFMEGGFPVLVNCEVLTEGTDIPVIDCVITARPTRSINLLAQMVGRGLRLSPETGKTDCHVIDIADNLSRGLTITPTLLGLSSDEVDEVSVDEVSEKKDRPETDGKPDRAPGKKVDEETNYQVTFVDESDPFGISKKPGEGSDYIPIQKITPNAWVACGDGKYVLEKFDSDYVKVSPNKHTGKTAKFAITDHTKNEEGWNLGRHYSKVKVVGYADTVDRALQTGDAYVTNQLGRDMAVQLRRSAQWRHRPATERQIAMIRTAKGVTEVQSDEGKIQTVKLLGKVVDLKKLTAGAVAAWISASKHGAFTVRKKNDRKAAQEEIKLQKRQEKEQEKAAREEAKMQKQQDKFMAKVQQQKAPKDLPFPVSYEYVGKVGTEGE